MPTPVQAFAEVASRHGDVDPGDLVAVQHFYRETLPTLEPATIITILEELLAREGSTTSEGPEPFYPGGAPLPSLRGSPPLLLPLFACGWREMLRRVLRSEQRGT